MKECPHHEEINKFFQTNPMPVVLTDPCPSQQQLIDHMSNQGNSSSSEEICMMSSKTINLQTRSQNYDKPASSPASSSNGPLTIKKPNLDMILHPPNSTLRNFVFNPYT